MVRAADEYGGCVLQRLAQRRVQLARVVLGGGRAIEYLRPLTAVYSGMKARPIRIDQIRYGRKDGVLAALPDVMTAGRP